jgi:hypothetical protein
MTKLRVLGEAGTARLYRTAVASSRILHFGGDGPQA